MAYVALYSSNLCFMRPAWSWLSPMPSHCANASVPPASRRTAHDRRVEVPADAYQSFASRKVGRPTQKIDKAAD